MANRVKRLEKELTLVKVENQFRGRFKKEKVKRKEGLRPALLLLVNARSKEAFGSHPLEKDLVSIFLALEKLRFRDVNLHQNFLQILAYPKPFFNKLIFYERLLEDFFELEICRNFATWQRPKSKDQVVIFKNLFCHLFVKYKIPVCLDEILDKYGSWECHKFQTATQILFHMVKGNGLHHFPGLPFKINSKVNYHFFNAPSQLDLYQAICWAMLIGKQVPYSIALKIVHKLGVLQDEFIWYKWLDDLIFFLNRFKDISQKDLKSIMDFFITQQSEKVCVHIPGLKDTIDVPPLYPGFKLKGRSVASVLRFCEEWKKYINLIKDIGKGANFKTSRFQPFRMSYGKTLVVIKQVKSVRGLVKEGKLMNHCVATYAGECASGESTIWTMKLYPPNQKAKKALTIEVLEENGFINEALGQFNRAASGLEEKWLVKWAEQEGLERS